VQVAAAHDLERGGQVINDFHKSRAVAKSTSNCRPAVRRTSC